MYSIVTTVGGRVLHNSTSYFLWHFRQTFLRLQQIPSLLTNDIREQLNFSTNIFFLPNFSSVQLKSCWIKSVTLPWPPPSNPVVQKYCQNTELLFQSQFKVTSSLWRRLLLTFSKIVFFFFCQIVCSAANLDVQHIQISCAGGNC